VWPNPIAPSTAQCHCAPSIYPHNRTRTLSFSSRRYYYYPPSWTAETAKSRHRHSGNWTSPFPSIWYCNAGSTLATKQLCRHPPKLPPNVYVAICLWHNPQHRTPAPHIHIPALVNRVIIDPSSIINRVRAGTLPSQPKTSQTSYGRSWSRRKSDSIRRHGSERLKSGQQQLVLQARHLGGASSLWRCRLNGKRSDGSDMPPHVSKYMHQCWFTHTHTQLQIFGAVSDVHGKIDETLSAVQKKIEKAARAKSEGACLDFRNGASITTVRRHFRNRRQFWFCHDWGCFNVKNRRGCKHSSWGTRA
jgi:hypothetical protein